MPDLSHDDINHANAPLAVASERQIWDSLNLKERAQILGQSTAGESNISNKKSVYQQDLKNRSYESMDYSSLPARVQYDVSSLLHEMGYFKETFGATVYEVDGEDRFECKDCEEPFISEEDLRVHRKINHDNEESETESQEAYNYSLQIDPSITKDNLTWARKVIRGESSRVSFPQNDPPTPMTPKLPKGRKEYDDNPNHYFYDNKLFKRGSRGSSYGQDGVALTEAKNLINLEDKILKKYGWESTIDIEKNKINREVFANEIAKVVNVENLHPRTIKIIDSVNRPFLVNTLHSLGAKWAKETVPEHYEDQVKEEPVIHQDYDPEHPHEHNAFDTYFGDKVAEEDGELEDPERAKLQMKSQMDDPYQEYEWQKGEEDQKDVTRTCPKCGFYSADEQELHSHVQDHISKPAEEDIEPEEWNQAEVPERKELLDTHNDFVPEEDLDNPYEELHPKTTASFDEPADEEHTGAHTRVYDAVKDVPGVTDPWALSNYVVTGQKGRAKKLESYSEEDFPFEDRQEQTTVNAEPDLLQNVNTDVIQVETEDYDPEEKVDKKTEEAKILQQYTGYRPKAGEAVGDILDGAIDVPVEQQTIEEEIYDRKLDGYHEDQIARGLGINHDMEYEDAIEKIRSIEVNYNDITAKTLFGKKFANCNEAEISEMKILGGEAKKRSTEKKA